MTTQLIAQPIWRLYDNSGALAVGGQVYTYQAGTTTPQPTYQDQTGISPNANPIITNTRGEWQMWLTPGLSYKIVAKDAAGNLLWSVDNVISADVLGSLAASNGSSLVSFLQSGTGAVTRTAQDKLRERVSALDFGAVGNGVADDAAAIQAALDYVGTTGGGTVYLPKTGSTYRITTGLKLPSFVTLEGPSPSGYPFNTGTVLLADFANVNQWIIEPKTLRGAAPVAYNSLITTPSPADAFTYNVGVRNLDIHTTNTVPFGGIRIHGCPGSVVEHVSVSGVGCGLLLNYSFGCRIRVHTIPKYYGVALFYAANANDVDHYSTIDTPTDTVPAGYLLSGMSVLNGTMIPVLALSTESHASRPWGLIVAGSSTDICANNEISTTIENFSGCQFHNYSYSTLIKRNYQEGSSVKFVHVEAISQTSSSVMHAFHGGLGVLFDLGKSVNSHYGIRGLISVSGWGTGPFLDTSSMVEVSGSSLGPSPPQFNVVHTSADASWVNVSSFSNGWASSGAEPAVSYRFNGRTGNTELRGELIAGSLGVAFVLPAGYRPIGRATFQSGAVTIDTSGNVQIVSGTTIYLDGIFFQALL